MNALLIILGIFIYLIIGATVTKLYNHFGVIDDYDTKSLFGLLMFFFPIIVIYVSATRLGKWFAKTIYDYIRLYKYNKSYKKNVKLKAKQTI